MSELTTLSTTVLFAAVHDASISYLSPSQLFVCQSDARGYIRKKCSIMEVGYPGRWKICKVLIVPVDGIARA